MIAANSEAVIELGPTILVQYMTIEPNEYDQLPRGPLLLDYINLAQLINHLQLMR